MNRSPAFQFYPDKWQSHTRRLSDSSYRVYHELLCWMWQNSEDHCSVHASEAAVACAVAMPSECVRIALAEILNPFSPLLKTEGDKWVSNGLRKEAAKQLERRAKAKASAGARWKDADAMRTHDKTDANASAKQCFPSPSPSPVPSLKEYALTVRAEASIPTWDDVKALATMRAVPEASAKSFFDHHEGNGLWLNQFGKLINWQHKLTTWAASDRQNPKAGAPKPTGAMGQPHELKLKRFI